MQEVNDGQNAKILNEDKIIIYDFSFYGLV